MSFWDMLSLPTDDEEEDFEETELKSNKSRLKEKKETATEAPKDVEEEKKTAPQPPEMRRQALNAKNTSRVVPVKNNSKKGQNSNPGVVVFKPVSFDESREIADSLLNGQTIILNIEGLDLSIAQSIINFVSGACYAIDGNLQKISNSIFIVTPESVDVFGDTTEITDLIQSYGGFSRM